MAKVKVTKKNRENIFSRDKVCLCCGTNENLTIDHIKPLGMGGSNKIENYQTLCTICNRNKSNKEIDYRKPIDNSIIPVTKTTPKAKIENANKQYFFVLGFLVGIVVVSSLYKITKQN